MSEILASIAEMRLRDPWMLTLVVLLPLAYWRRRRRRVPATLFAPGALAEGLPNTWRTYGRRIPSILFCVGFLSLILAMARPARRDQLPLEAEGIDILLCLDVSSSMAAQDMAQDRSRLQLAKQAAKDFIGGRTEDRIGLLSFARYPDLICPLTLQHSLLTNLLDQLEMVEPDGPEDLTGIGMAVARAAKILERSTAKSKVVILLTDGEENVAQSAAALGPVQAAQICKERDVRVYTIAAGIGRQDNRGNWAALDTEPVKLLAEATEGQFYEARDANAVNNVYQYINRLEKAQFKEPRYQLKDILVPFLWVSWLAILASRFLRSSLFEALP